MSTLLLIFISIAAVYFVFIQHRTLAGEAKRQHVLKKMNDKLDGRAAKYCEYLHTSNDKPRPFISKTDIDSIKKAIKQYETERNASLLPSVLAFFIAAIIGLASATGKSETGLLLAFGIFTWGIYSKSVNVVRLNKKFVKLGWEPTKF